MSILAEGPPNDIEDSSDPIAIGNWDKKEADVPIAR